MEIKKSIIKLIRSTGSGNRKFYQIKHLLGRDAVPDINFPELISIEISSLCNLACIHCPPHMKEFSSQVRTHNHMDVQLFNRLMDEIDRHGARYIALHKDGEPLLHPRLDEILKRVKMNLPHVVYITTNAQNLNQQKIEMILENKIDVMNFSIGAASEAFYRKVRGKGYSKVMDNIQNFLTAVSNSTWKPKVTVQIIDLPEHPEMKQEIKSFKEFWGKYNVEISVWEKLTWGALETRKFSYRYPCYSLWHSFNVNSNGQVTACCMDWKQELLIGDSRTGTVNEIWHGKKLEELRTKHVNGEEDKIDACRHCNYWQWQPMLLKYQ